MSLSRSDVRSYLSLISLIVFALACAVGCKSRSDSDSQVLTVSIDPQRWLLEQIVGPRFEVRALLGGGANPESYEPSFNQIADLERSRAYLTVGNLGFESAILAKMRENNPQLRVFCTSDSIPLIHAAHGSHDHGVDPHVWSSAPNMKRMAANMLVALRALDPEHIGEYESNFNRLALRIDSVDAACNSILAPLRGSAFMVWHPSLSYFARDYGLVQLSLGAEGKEHSVSQTRDLLDSMDAAGAQVFLVQKNFDPEQAKAIAAGVRTAVIDPLNYDWDREMLLTAGYIAGK